MSDYFVPEDFAVPGGLQAEGFRLEPLGPRHNDADYAAWTSSMSHIQATPGFTGTGWPHEMTLAENLSDLERHARDYADRRGFTYTVLSTSDGDVIGCVYIYPASEQPDQYDVAVSSWVRADHAELDPVLYRTVLAWLEQAWPFRSIRYEPRA